MNIAIIGAGVVGVSSAYYLHQQGHNVSVFESLPSSGLETSFANAGLITPSLCDPWNSPGIVWNVLKNLCQKNPPIRINARAIPSLLSWGMQFIRNSSTQRYLQNFERNVLLANYSLQLLDELTKELDLDFSYQKSGTLKVFRDATSAQQLQQFMSLSKQLNIASEWLDIDALIDKEPALLPIKSELLGGVFYPDDALGDSYRFTQNLAQFLEQNQVKFFYDSKVELINDGNGVCAIAMNEKCMAFDSIVLAAGCASSQLARPLNIHLPIQPLKGYSMTVSSKHWAIKPHIPLLDHERHIAITPIGNNLRITSTAEFAGFDKTIQPKPIDNLKRLLLDFYPCAAEHMNDESVSYWTGLRPTSVDGVPFISETPYKNLYLNTGHGHLGWTLALGSGKLIAEMIAGHQSNINKKAYRLGRL